jgi:hypothetical protein
MSFSVAAIQCMGSCWCNEKNMAIVQQISS